MLLLTTPKAGKGTRPGCCCADIPVHALRW